MVGASLALGTRGCLTELAEERLMTTTHRSRRSSVPTFSAALAALGLALALPARAEDVVRVSGTGTALGMLEKMVAPFEAAYPGTRLAPVTNLGGSGSILAAGRGDLEVAITGRPVKEDERAQGLVSFEFARTPFVFAASPRLRVTNLTADELARIYRGQKARWASGESISPVLRPRTDGDTAILRRISPEVASALDAALQRPGALLTTTNQECNEAIERTKGAFGPTTLMQLSTERRALSPARWNGVEPTLANMEAGRYPLVKSLFLVVRRDRGPVVRRWLEFVASAKGKKLLQELGASPVPFTPE